MILGFEARLESDQTWSLRVIRHNVTMYIGFKSYQIVLEFLRELT